MGDVGLIIGLGMDSAQAEAALDSFAVKSRASFAASQNASRALTDAMLGVRPQIDLLKDGMDQFGQIASKAGKEVTHRLAEAHESARLLEVMLGTRLPRAVSTAVGTMIPSLASLSTYLIAIFALREMAEAIANWDKFKDAAVGLLQPFSELEVKVANALGFLKDYTTEATEAAVAEQKANDKQRQIIETMLDTEEKVKQARLSGTALIWEQNRYEQEKAKREESNAAASDKYFVRRTNQAKETLGQIRLGQEGLREQREEARKAAEEGKRAHAELMEQKRKEEEADKRTFEFRQRARAMAMQEASEQAKIDAAATASHLATEKWMMTNITLDNQLFGVEQRHMQLLRSAIPVFQQETNVIVHLSAAKKEYLWVTQMLREAEEREVKATQEHIAADVQLLTSGMGGLIAGRRAQAGVEAVWEIGRGIAMLAEGTWPPNPAALVAAGLHFEAAAQYGKIALSGSGGRQSARSGGSGYGTRDTGGYADSGSRIPDSATIAPGAGGAGRFGPGSGLVMVFGGPDVHAWMAKTVTEATNRGYTVSATHAQRGTPVGH